MLESYWKGKPAAAVMTQSGEKYLCQCRDRVTKRRLRLPGCRLGRDRGLEESGRPHLRGGSSLAFFVMTSNKVV